MNKHDLIKAIHKARFVVVRVGMTEGTKADMLVSSSIALVALRDYDDNAEFKALMSVGDEIVYIG